MKVLILKNHNSGLREGQIKDFPERSANMLIEKGIGQLIDQEIEIKKSKKLKK